MRMKGTNRREFLRNVMRTGIALGAGSVASGWPVPPRLADAAAARRSLTVLYLTRSDVDRKVLDDALRDFEQQTSGIKVSLELSTLEKLPEALQTRISSRDFPGLAYVVGNRVPALERDGLLADVSAYLPAEFRKEFVPFRWGEVQYGSRVVGVPIGHGVRALAYNVDYFEKAGIEVPKKPEEAWTWAEFPRIAERLMKSANAKFGLLFEGGAGFDQWAGIHYQAGGTLLTPNLTAPAVNSAAGLQALEWALDLHRRKITPQGVIQGTETPDPLFTSGIAAMWMVGQWKLPTLAEQMTKYRFSFTYMPREKRHCVLTTGGVWVVFKSKQVEDAAALLRVLASPKHLNGLAGARGQETARIDTTGFRLAGRSDLSPLFHKQAEVGYQPQLQREMLLPFYGATRDRLMAEVGRVMNGQTSAKQCLEAQERIIAEALKVS